MNFSVLKIDWKLVIPVIVLLFVSLTTLFSVDVSVFKSQLIYAIASIFIYFVCSQINFKSLENYGLYIYVASLILLTVVLILGIESRGAMRWVEIAGVRIQFSEILKPFLAISLASFLAVKKNTSNGTLALALLLLLPIAFLIYKQPDLGNALIYLGTVLLTLIIYGFSLRWFVIGGVALVISIPVLWQFLHQYQKERLLTFFHMTNDPLGISYNSIQAVIAVGSGMFLGKGLGQGTQSSLRFLPEHHTDFIFSTLSEELGFLGGFIVIVAFCLLFYRMYQIFQQAEDNFSKVFVLCAFSLLLIQFFVNIGMNIGIVPIVGVTLPFVSYGGSSLLSSSIFLGLVSSIGNDNTRKQVLEIT